MGYSSTFLYLKSVVFGSVYVSCLLVYLSDVVADNFELFELQISRNLLRIGCWQSWNESVLWQ